MIIPQSTLEPFGYTGMPPIRDHTTAMINDISRRIDAINARSREQGVRNINITLASHADAITEACK